MTKYNELEVSANKNRKRVGRGISAGQGKTAGRGQKGQWSPSGGGVRPGFEGGQTSLMRRLPKRGFNNFDFETKYTVIDLDVLNRFEEGTEVTAELLKETKTIKKIEKDGIKILGSGNLEKKLTVKANKFTGSAASKIEAAGGKAEVI